MGTIFKEAEYHCNNFWVDIILFSCADISIAIRDTGQKVFKHQAGFYIFVQTGSDVGCCEEQTLNWEEISY